MDGSAVWRVAALAVAIGCAVGCGSEDGDGTNQNAVSCAQQPVQPCMCSDGSQSTLACLPDGTTGACNCSAGTAGTSAAGSGAAGSAGMGLAGTAGMGASGAGDTTGTAGVGAAAGAGVAGMNAAGAGGGDMAGAGGMAGMEEAGAGGSGGMPGPAGEWPAADPAGMGPFQPMTEQNVGPGNAYTMFRPADLASSGKRHPVITWGNGTGTMPNTYSRLLNQLASHGFVVIASNSTNVAQGNPPPMLAGVTWVIEQNDVPESPLYQRIDVDRVGATGHSQGAFATSTAGADPRIKATAPIQGARAGTLHGPALLLCGGMDTVVPCSGSERAFSSINSVPVMYANLLAADHTNWIASGFLGMPSPYFEAVVAWMRVHLMDDQSLRGMFYGASCELCGDSAWQVMRKMMD